MKRFAFLTIALATLTLSTWAVSRPDVSPEISVLDRAKVSGDVKGLISTAQPGDVPAALYVLEDPPALVDGDELFPAIPEGRLLWEGAWPGESGEGWFRHTLPMEGVSLIQERADECGWIGIGLSLSSHRFVEDEWTADPVHGPYLRPGTDYRFHGYLDSERPPYLAVHYQSMGEAPAGPDFRPGEEELSAWPIESGGRPGLASEIKERRDAYSRHFMNPDGSLTAMIFGDRINYRDEEGDWRPIDNRLRLLAGDGASYQNGSNRFRTLFPEVSGDSGIVIGTDPDRSVEIWLSPSIGWTDDAGQTHWLEETDRVSGRVEESRIEYHDVLPGFGVRFTQTGEGVERVCFLSDVPDSAGAGVSSLVLAEEWALPDGWTVWSAGEPRWSDFISSAGIELRDVDGETVLELSKVALEGVGRFDTETLSARGPYYEIEFTPHGFILILRIDLDAFPEEEVLFPLVLTSTITVPGTGSEGGSGTVDEWGRVKDGEIRVGALPKELETRGYLQFNLESLEGVEILESSLELYRIPWWMKIGDFFGPEGADPEDGAEVEEGQGSGESAGEDDEGTGDDESEGDERDEKPGEPIRAMSGTYSIRAGGGGNYFSFTEAVNALISQGVSGPVIFEVYNGTYTEQVGGAGGIPAISGASSSNTITFREAAGQSVTIDGSTHGIYIHGGDYLTFEGFTITSCTEYGVYNFDASNRNTFRDLSISNVGTSGNYAGVRVEQNCDYTVVEGCAITGDYYGIDVYSSAVDGCRYTALRGNQITNATRDGIRVEGSSSTYFHQYTDIYNNMISGAMSYYGMYLRYVGDDDVYFNSIYNTSGGGIYIHARNSTYRPDGIKNNVVRLTSSSSKYGIYVTNADSLPNPGAMDYNDWYAPTANVGRYAGNTLKTMADWQTGTGRDLNSICQNPRYASTSDLHILTYSPCQTRGVAVPGFTTDYDGQGRGSPPDMGADEETTALTPMSGTYSIRASGGGNFTSFTEAVDNLTGRGLSGPVIFNVYNGTYVEQVGGTTGLGAARGASAVNTITFREAAGQSVTIDGVTNGIYVYGGDYLTFEGFTITSCTGDGVYVYETADNNTLRNLTISNAGTTGDFAGIRIERNCANTVVEGCSITGDYYGIMVYSAGTAGCRYTVLRGNQITNATRDGIRVEGSASSYFHQYTDIYNNMISGAMANYGMYLRYVGDDDVYFNSIYNTSGGGIYIHARNSTYRPDGIKNNVVRLTSSSSKYGIYVTNADSLPFLGDMDYNDWYAPTANVGRYAGNTLQTLADWQAGTGRDLNSICQNPRYVSTSDLHIQTYSPCQTRGVAVPGFTTDYDGQGRGSSPDMGADEEKTALTPMSGTYSIRASGGGNFTSFTEAVDNLTGRGLSGPVIFNVYNGTYVEQVGGTTGLGAARSASATNTITFREAAGQSVTIDGGTNGIYVYGGDYFTFEGFTITSCTGDGAYIYETADSNTLRNLTISNAGTTGDFAGIRIERNCANTVVEGCSITGDYYGIHVYSAGTAGCHDTVLRGNRITDATRDGIRVEGSAASYFHQYTDIYNNMISGAMANYGMYLRYVGDDDIYFNSIYNTSGGGIYIHARNSTYRPDGIKNNVVRLTSSSSKYGIYVTNADSLPNPGAMDYNDWYAPTANVGRYAGNTLKTMADWQTGTGRDLNSICQNPRYASTSDLHILTYSPCQTRGVAVPGFTTDYDGQGRGSPPDMGADEEKTALPSMSGTYSIRASGGGSFTSFTEAVDNLTGRGVSGPVVFNVYNGTYAEQVGGITGLGAVRSASSTNTITFREAAGQTVTIDGGTNGIYVYGGDYLTFEGFTITSCTGDGAYIYETADSNTLRDLTISNAGTSGDYAGIRIERNCNSTLVEGCAITGDYYGIHVYSAGTAGCPYTVLRGNRIMNATRDGIRVEGSASSYFHQYTDIYNNMISGAMANYGMYLRYVGDDDIYFNSIYNTSGGGIYIHARNSTYRPDGIKNNVVRLTSSSSKYGIYVTNADSLPFLGDMDYNDWYAPTANVGRYAGTTLQTLVDWQTTTGRDGNSISQNPLFVSSSDLHIQELSPCRARGIDVALVTSDYDGHGRGSPPDMGADEHVVGGGPLSGFYTIRASGGGDYASFTEAVDDLTGRGVDGPVTFDVYSGTYVEQVGGPTGFGAISGASAANTITFREASGETVTIDGSTNGIYVYGGDYLTFVGFTITSCTGDGVYIYETADSNTLRNLTIDNAGTAGDYAGVRIDRNCQYTTVEECTITGDYYGIMVYSAGTAGCPYTVLRGNRITNATRDGIRVEAASSSYFHQYADIYNNMISGAMANYGMYLRYVGDDDIYFNSIYNTSGGGIYIHARNATYRPDGIKNNVVHLTGSGARYGIYVTNADSLPDMGDLDYNDWYAPSAYVGRYSGTSLQTLAEWQTTTIRDLNSLSQDPDFVSTSDLHIQASSPCLDSGVAVIGYTTDFDGEARSDPPDMGADESGATGDSDGDGIPDASDNCPDVYNPGQADANVNGIGDDCETNVNAYIRAISGDPSAGRPSWDPSPSNMIYEDVFRIQNDSASQAILLPMAAVLETLTPGSVIGDNVDNTAHSGGRPPDACWRYTEADSEGTVGDLSDGTLDPGERIARVWRVYDPAAVTFTFWANVMAAGPTTKRVGGEEGMQGAKGIQGPTEERDEGGFPEEPYSAFDRVERGAGGTEYFYDDGSAEIHVGSVSGEIVVANRFDAHVPVRLKAVSFYTSGVAAGGRAEVIVYEDPTGTGPGPEPSMEVVRVPIALGSGGFQEVPLGDLLLNEAGEPDAAFYVAVANLDERSYSLGTDLNGPAGASSYLSTDGGLTYEPLDSSPIIDGNAMIRAWVEETGECFIGTVAGAP